MSERSTRSLHRGHAGDGSYNSIDRIWRYPTSSSNAPLQLVLRDPTQPAFGPKLSSGNLNGHLHDGRVVEEILDNYPEFLGARQAISRSLKASNTDHIQRLQDFPAGPLLCTVRIYATHVEQPSFEKQHTLVVAFVGDLNGEGLRLVPSLPRYPQPSFRKTPASPFQAFSHPEARTWKGNGKTIRQICFSTQMKTMSVLLAARSESSVEVLIVKVRCTGRSAAQLNCRDAANVSRLEMNHLATLNAPEEDSSFMHVSFNPWKPTSIATVTSSGDWQIWDINLRKGVVNIAHNETSADKRSEKAMKGKANTHDESYRIFWLGDKSTVLICSASHFEIVDLRTDRRTQGKAGWLTDSKVQTFEVLVRQTSLNDIFIVASSRIHWLRLNMHNDLDDGRKDAQPNLNMVLSWTHDRDRNDPTLRLAHLDFPGGFYLYLYSRRSSLIERFRVADVSNDSKRLAQSAHIAVLGRPMNDLDIQPFLNEMRDTQHDSLNTSQVNKNHLIHTICLTSDFCLDGFVSLDGPRSSSYTTEVARLATQAAPEKLQSIKEAKGKNKPRSTDAFIVQDEDCESGSEGRNESSTFPTRDGSASRAQQHETWEATKLSRSPNVTMQILYYSILQPPVVNENSLSWSLQVVFQGLRELAQKGSITLMPLSSLLPLNRAVGDLTSFAKATQDSENSFVQEFQLKYDFTSPSRMLGEQGEMQDCLLSSIYQSLLSDWHVPLSHRVPSQIRLTKERILRRTAIDLYLSSRCIMPRATISPSQEQPAAPEQLRASQPRDGDAPASSVSAENPHDATRINNDISDDASPSISLLQRYAVIGNTTPSTSATMKDILSQWKPGTDPESYNYSATAAASSAAKARAHAPPQDSKRARLKRRAEKQLSRSANRSMDRRSSADPRVTASQPSAQHAPFFSSQDAAPSQGESQNAASSLSLGQAGMTASQVQSGRFGGRRLPTRAGGSQAKRKSGF